MEDKKMNMSERQKSNSLFLCPVEVRSPEPKEELSSPQQGSLFDRKKYQKEYNKKYYLENKERLSKYWKQWYQKNKEHIKQYDKEYFERNKERILKRNRKNWEKYYLENKGKISEYRKEYEKKNPEKIKEKKKRFKKTHPNYTKDYFQKNKLILFEKQKKYNREHRTEINQWSKEYYQKNKEKVKGYKKKYKKTHRNYVNKKRRENYQKCREELCEKKRLKRHQKGENKRYRWEIKGIPDRIHKQRYLARKRNAGDLPIERIQQVYEDNIKKYGTLTCYLCYKPIEFGKDCLEHKISPLKGGTNAYENLAISHQNCNNAKWKRTEEEYRAWLAQKEGSNG